MSEETQTNFDDNFGEDDQVSTNINLWDYKVENAVIIGVVKNVDDEGQYGRTLLVDTETEQDVTIPSLTALNTKLQKAGVGDKIKIVSKGLVAPKTKGGRSYYDFDVFVKKKPE